MTSEQAKNPMAQALIQLTPYGYTLTDAGVIHRPDGKATGVKLVPQPMRGKIQARGIEHNTLLWTGADAGDFVASYWYARKVQP